MDTTEQADDVETASDTSPKEDPLFAYIDGVPPILLDGRYRVVRRIGAGGMGAVYEAVHEALNGHVAIKILMPRFAEHQMSRKRFLREARAIRAIDSENVVRIADFGVTSDDIVYLVMEYLEGEDLESYLEGRGKIPWKSARPIILQIAKALGAAHERGIIHRDIKPANCFLVEGKDGVPLVKVLDFGLAKENRPEEVSPLVSSGVITHSGSIVGTPAYMAPEAAENAADTKSDIYSLGVLMFRVLTGRLPFVGGSMMEVLSQHILRPPPVPHLLEPGIPEPVSRAILKTLHKKPEERFEDVSMLVAVLEASPTVVSRAVEHEQRAKPGPSRSTRPIGWMIAGLLVVGAGALWLSSSATVAVEEGSPGTTSVSEAPQAPDASGTSGARAASTTLEPAGVEARATTGSDEPSGSTSGSSGEDGSSAGVPRSVEPTSSAPPRPKKRRKTTPSQALKGRVELGCPDATGRFIVRGLVGVDGRFVKITEVSGGTPQSHRCIEARARDIELEPGSRRFERLAFSIGGTR